MHRLQTAHSFWTQEPPVFPNEYPEFGVHGRGGKLYDWYGIGQPLLMLPADMVGTYLQKLPIFANYNGADPTIRNIFVTYSVNIFLNIITALACFRFLKLLGFDIKQSTLGVLALLFCTTHLHYTQNMMENNYIFVLTLVGFTYGYEWVLTNKGRALAIGAGAFGMNLLTRLTTGLDLMAGTAFLILVLGLQGGRKTEFFQRALAYLKTAVPIYLFFIMIDRVYQFYRFGTWADTYVHYFTIEHRLQDPNLPASYPWETPFHIGFLGPLFSPEKSIFLFDPLILLTILLAIVSWHRFTAPVKAYVLATLGLVLSYISLYARYTVWSGNFAWGDRYVSTAVELAALVSVPLLLKYWRELTNQLRIVGLSLISLSLVVQVASLAFWLPLEIYQADDFGHPQWIIWLRFRNIVAFALGKMDTWGLNTDSMGYDQWDFQHITTWNFLPFVLRRMGEAPRWAVNFAFLVWELANALMVISLLRLRTWLRTVQRT